MKSTPIIFKSEMVQAIFAGTKTQTRRIIKPQPNTIKWQPIQSSARFDGWSDEHGNSHPCPYGQANDRLWVRETWLKHSDATGDYAYRAGLDGDNDADGFFGQQHGGWKPSIHMPRIACRLELEITDIRIEKLNVISHDDAIDEGVSGSTNLDLGQQSAAQYLYADLWEKINGAGSWDLNPWVWVVEFKRTR